MDNLRGVYCRPAAEAAGNQHTLSGIMVPRALGGKFAHNLIRLTPEDHFCAFVARQIRRPDVVAGGSWLAVIGRIIGRRFHAKVRLGRPCAVAVKARHWCISVHYSSHLCA
jgi:hypothetical protein